MTTRRHLTALPKGTAFPVDTSDLPDGYPFLRTDEGVLYEWDLGTTTFVAITSPGGGALDEVVSYYIWEGDQPDIAFAASGDARYLMVPTDATHEMVVNGAGALPIPYIDYEFTGTEILSKAVLPPGTWAVSVDASINDVLPGDGIRIALRGTDEGDYGPAAMVTVPYGRTDVQASFQFVGGGDDTSEIYPKVWAWFNTSSPALAEYGLTARMLSVVDPDFQPPPILAPALAITSPGTGQVNVAWVGGQPTAGEIYLVNMDTGLTVSSYTLSAFSPTTNHLFTGITSGLNLRAVVIPTTTGKRGSMSPDGVTVA